MQASELYLVLLELNSVVHGLINFNQLLIVNLFNTG